jgi:hypothetical protein
MRFDGGVLTVMGNPGLQIHETPARTRLFAFFPLSALIIF